MLSIAASGLRAYQGALGAVSENIANAATPGYSRRQVQIEEVSGTGASALQTVTTVGLGARVAGISRAADAQKAEAARQSGADLAKTTSGVQWLSAIDGALTGNALGDRITAFFAAAKPVAADPSASAPRAAMLEAAASVASAFTATGTALDTAQASLSASGDAAAANLTTLAKSLAQVNDALARATPGSAGAASVADQRDQLLDQMSAISDINVALDSAGRATVRLGNAGGPVMVAPDGNGAGTLTFAQNSSGAVSFALLRGGAASIASPNGGALAGIVDGAQRIADARQALDQIASDFASGVNAVQAQGRDLDGNPGAAMFATGARPTELSLAIADPRKIAAAGVGTGPRDNSNLANLDALRSGADSEGQVTDLVTGNAAALAGRKTVADAQGAIHDGAVQARDAISGVNIDDEAVDLLRFQQAYAAAGRVIQTARDVMNTILEIH